MMKEISSIALTFLDIDNLETQKSDEKDFHKVSVWELKAALMAAYIAGYEDHVKRNKETS